MADLSPDFFQDRGREYADRDLSDYDAEVTGIAAEAIAAELTDDSPYELDDLVGYAMDRGVADDAIALKAELTPDEMDIKDVTQEAQDQARERATYTAVQRMLTRQIEAVADELSKGIRGIARVHRETEDIFDEEAQEETETTLRGIADRMYEAGVDKGLRLREDEVLEMDYQDARSVASEVDGVNGNQSHDDLAEDLRGVKKDELEDVDLDEDYDFL